jgi:DNA-binding PadR family transcriptional regulator
MTRRKVSNPLALAVLACLFERPMHPYEMATTLRERGKDQSIKLNYGSLYTVVEALQQHRLIVAQETEREGRRPERTVYRLTAPGRIELVDWVSELLSTPSKEFTRFEAGLSLAGVLAPDEVVALLTQRCRHLEIEIATMRSGLQFVQQQGLARLFVIESEYSLAMREAELAWTRGMAEEIRSGTIEGIDQWAAFQRTLAEREDADVGVREADAALREFQRSLTDRKDADQEHPGRQGKEEQEPREQPEEGSL